MLDMYALLLRECSQFLDHSQKLQPFFQACDMKDIMFTILFCFVVSNCLIKKIFIM